MRRQGFKTKRHLRGIVVENINDTLIVFEKLREKTGRHGFCVVSYAKITFKFDQAESDCFNAFRICYETKQIIH